MLINTIGVEYFVDAKNVALDVFRKNITLQNELDIWCNGT